MSVLSGKPFVIIAALSPRMTSFFSVEDVQLYVRMVKISALSGDSQSLTHAQEVSPPAKALGTYTKTHQQAARLMIAIGSS